jgi:predicted Zn finger-like uncharacterized protein
MKFVCDKCHTKYSIADERVHGRVLKIRCKSCSNVITVREEKPAAAPAPSVTTQSSARPAPTARRAASSIDEAFGPAGGLFGDDGEHTMVSQGPPGDAGTAGDDWYVSFDGEQEGPMSLDAAIARVRTERPKGREAHCWNPGLLVWRPVEEVAEFAPALAPRPGATPPAVPSGARGTGRTSTVSSAVGQPHSVGSSSGGASSAGGATASATGGAAPAGGARVRGDGPRGGLAVGAVAAAEALPQPEMAPQVTKPETRSALRGAPARTPEGPYARSSTDERAGALSQTSALPDKPRSGAPPIPAAAKPSSSTTGSAKALDTKSPASSTGKAPAIAPRSPEPQPDAVPTSPVEGAGATRVDSGPTPLPPPPGGQPSDDLVISEPSGLFSLAHLSADLARGAGPSKVSPVKPAPAATATPARGAAAQGSAAAAGGLSDEVLAAAGPVVPNAAPVVVVAGPAVTKTPPWVKFAAIGGALVSLGLGGALIFVLLKKDPAPVAVTPPTEPPATRRADDTPIAVAADPGPAAAVAAAPKDVATAPSTAKRPVTTPKTTAPSPPAGAGKGLTDSQRNLAALYAEGDDKGSPRELPVVDRTSRPSGGQVSQNAILGVVTQNRRSLNLCYDRVLKRDSSLKRARLVTHVKVGISGSVVGVSIADPEYAKSEIGTCITQAVKHWHFPANDSEYETEFPIILQAE